QPGACGQTTRTWSPAWVSCRIRFMVRLTTPSILGRKTSVMIAIRTGHLPRNEVLASIHHLLGEGDHDVVTVLDREEEEVHQQARRHAGLVQAEGFDKGR